jgi:hypothetical protein
MLASPALAQQRTEAGNGAVLRGLDKLTGQTQDLEMAAGSVTQFGRLTIALTECRFPAGNRSGDAFAGLDIREEGQTEPVFRGWMIASAPALSAMDHAQYDIWVIRCTTS